MTFEGHESIFFGHDVKSGLRTIIAIHSTKLGPSLGGCRIFAYPDEESALTDVVRLSKAMTYKASLAGLKLGGGKSVIIANPETDKTPELLLAYARCVDRLGGAYITAEDAGTSPQDMDIIRKHTRYVTGASRAFGGAGDPSPVTALGVFEGIKACVAHVFGSTSLEGKTIAIQGVGHVGYPLAKYLKDSGAHLVVSDKNTSNVERARTELGARAVGLDEIFAVPCDVFSPCAMGGAINEKTISQIKAKIIAGAANNQLASDEMGEQLMTKGVVYAPDFAINAGGLIHVAQELDGYDREKVETKVKNIFHTIEEILKQSAGEKVSSARIAVRLAQQRLQ
jgi:leucine dehydrogenase